MTSDKQLKIGWASADITPDQPVQLAGQHYARISEGVLDPVTATALALESGGQGLIMISCDLVSISDSLRDSVRKHATAQLPELAATSIILNATHTHSAPMAKSESDEQRRLGESASTKEIDLPCMSGSDYIDWASRRIADAAVNAWQQRTAGSIGFGLGHAVVGHNRRMTYTDGSSRMYGKTDDENFSHVEGYEDHSVNVLATWDAAGELTGVVVNLACPSQFSEHIFQISADYWHETRTELRRRLGKNIFVLPQCSAAGDQSPRIPWQKAAEERMQELTGRTRRQEIAVRISDAVEAVLPHIAKQRMSDAPIAHTCCTIELPRMRLTEADVKQALAQAEPFRVEYEKLLRDLEGNPAQLKEPRWYVPITRAYRKWRWSARVQLRYELEQTQPRMPVEVHVIRIGDVAIATNPFEYYLDYGICIKARSPAVQTFLVQLAGSGTYVSSQRAAAAGGYGSVPASTPIGTEGGRMLEQWTLQAINSLWGEKVDQPQNAN